MMDKEVQFSTLDEHRYHEILVHPALYRTRSARSILILGGGDGLAAREVYKWEGVETVTIVDYDEFFVRMSKDAFCKLNKNSLHDSRTQLLHMDAYEFCRMENDRKYKYDAIFIDLPDPDGPLETLYMNCLQECCRLVKEGGTITLHTGGLSLDPAAPCWTILHSLASVLCEAGLELDFRSIYVPSFMNQWGFLTGYTERNSDVRLTEMPRIWTPSYVYDSEYQDLFRKTA
jgi:spermidine synthase